MSMSIRVPAALLGAGLLAEMAVSAIQDGDLVALPAPDAIPECTAWAVLPRERVLRDYTVELLVALAPQLDRHDLRRTLAGNQNAQWPAPPTWGGMRRCGARQLRRLRRETVRS